MNNVTIKSLTVALVLAAGFAAHGLSAASLSVKERASIAKFEKMTGKKVVSSQRINDDDWQGTQVTYADGSGYCYDETNQMSCTGTCPCK